MSENLIVYDDIKKIDDMSAPDDRDILLDVVDVSMRFRMPTEKIDNLKEYVIKFVKRKIKYVDFWAVKNVSLQVKRGESVGLIGHNGAGKSTLLRMLAGIIEPSSGYVKTQGNIVPLLKLGAGFDMNATGKENVFLNGAILGYSHKEMAKRYDKIVEFAELEKFMNVPLKNYSSGMLARLGFSIAVDVKPDVLLIDEILSVGDASFQKKCAAKIEELQRDGVTFVVVSHNMSAINKLCQRAIWFDQGQIHMAGDVKTVSDAYIKHWSDK